MATGSAEAAAAAGADVLGKAKGAAKGKGRAGKGRKGPEESLLTKDIEKQIEKLSEEAGKRAAARALLENTDLDPEAIVRKALTIAGEICIYTNQHHTVETIGQPT